MKTTNHGIEDSKDVENIYHMLLREKGYKGAQREAGGTAQGIEGELRDGLKGSNKLSSRLDKLEG